MNKRMEKGIKWNRATALGVLIVASTMGAAAQTVTGSATTNTVPVFTGTSTIGNSPISISSGNVGAGTTTPANLLQVGSGGTSGKSVIYSQDANHGQLQIGNPASNAEASINLESGVTSFGDSPASQNGTSNLWGLGACVWSIGGNKFVLGNDGYGGPILTAQSNGNVGIGTTTPGAKLEENGGIRFTTDLSGTVQTTAWTGVLCGGDYAEAVDARGDRKRHEHGDVLVLGSGDDGEVEKSNEPYSTMVTCIFATKPGVIGRRETMSKSAQEIPMAMVGIVPTKVIAENGPIRRGDLLVSSSTPGYAMKGTDRNRMLGAVIGKAMGTLDSGTGVIEVVVTLQ